MRDGIISVPLSKCSSFLVRGAFTPNWLKVSLTESASNCQMLPRPESSLCAVLELTLIDPVAKLLLKKEKKKSPVLYSEMYALVLLYSY